jgi:hypothetical protein
MRKLKILQPVMAAGFKTNDPCQSFHGGLVARPYRIGRASQSIHWQYCYLAFIKALVFVQLIKLF